MEKNILEALDGEEKKCDQTIKLAQVELKDLTKEVKFLGISPYMDEHKNAMLDIEAKKRIGEAIRKINYLIEVAEGQDLAKERIDQIQELKDRLAGIIKNKPDIADLI